MSSEYDSAAMVSLLQHNTLVLTMHRDVVTHFTFVKKKKNHSSCNLDIALGNITISITVP